MRGLILSVALGAAALGGCYTTGEVGYSATYSTGAYVSTPDLVAVGPGVQVVADYDEPIFFADGFYWRFNEGYWYRSNNYASGWYFYERPPVAVLRIDRPYAYRHYRPPGYVARRNVRYQPPQRIERDHRGPGPGYGPPAARPPVYQQPGPVVRDHRAAPPPPAPRPAPAAPAPVVRDHRDPPPREHRETRDHRH